jgi:hypothetical protein
MIFDLEERPLPAVASLGDVMRDSGNHCAWEACHGTQASHGV